ncbi:MAG TPA: hypothetical protein VEJ45_05510 [Candidatus Acidoferrales bacterium]|nr:hypothetical protein [Candidatus Acidoferrales bacterium]
MAVLFVVLTLAPLAPVAFGQTQPQAGDGVDRLIVHLSDPTRPGTVKVSLLNGSIAVKSYDGKDVNIEARLRDEPPGRIEETKPGMHRYSVGTSGLTADEENNEVHVRTDSLFRTVDLTLTVPVHTSLSLRSVNAGSVSVTGGDGDLDVSVVNGTIVLSDISGSTVAHTINGPLSATFAHLNPAKPVAFSSINGELDLTLPSEVKATLNLHAERGQVFSDFDLQFQNSAGQPIPEGSNMGARRGTHMPFGGGGHATINGGGTDIQLSNFNGNIYIHKTSTAR